MNEFSELENILKSLRPLPPSPDLRRRCVAARPPDSRTYYLWGVAALLVISLALWSHYEAVEVPSTHLRQRHPQLPGLTVSYNFTAGPSGEIFGKYLQYGDSTQNFLALRQNLCE